jgi:pimeloyl-ACP methyl ester carboxylesterase
MAQRIVGRLASLIEGAEMHHLPSAGHMLPLTHARQINPQIAAHIARADDPANAGLRLSA